MLVRELGFLIDERRFAHEAVDGEVIIMDVEEGTYYALGGSASQIWPVLVGGAAFQEILDWAARRFPDASEKTPGAIETFLATLTDEGIISQQEVDPGASLAIPGPAGEPFALPTFDKYTDMQDILTLDPIHDVDDLGWPHRARDSDADL
jgi:hypothetical protein